MFLQKATIVDVRTKNDEVKTKRAATQGATFKPRRCQNATQGRSRMYTTRNKYGRVKAVAG
jgi:hypothetical protein